jgi:hypothetical protein
MRRASPLVCLLVALVGVGEFWPRAVRAAEAEPSAGEHYNLGAKALEDGDATLAVTELTASLAAKPSLRAYLLRADAQVKLSHFDEARADYEAALRLEPTTHKRAAIERWLHELTTGTRTRLAVTSDPPGATVYVDLKAAGKRGVTPIVIPTPPGRHRVILELDGYDPFVAREVNAVEDRETALAATLLVKGCDLRVAATPATSTVALDGGPAQPTPFTARVRGGEHTLAFAEPNRLPRQKSLRCQIGTALDVAETLEPIPPGRLVMELPPGSHVRVDGREAASPALVAPGDHTVRVEAPEKEPWQTALHVDGGQEIRLQPSLSERRRGKSKTWLWVGVGIAAAGVAVGLGVGLGVGLSGDAAPIGHFGGFHIFSAQVGGGSR